MNKTIIIFGSAFVALSASAFFLYQPSIKVVTSNSSDVITQNTTKMAAHAPLKLVEDTRSSEVERFIQSMSAKMKQAHGHEIQSVSVQLSMGDFKAFVLEQFPNNGHDVFMRIIKNAFPEYAQAIFDLLNTMATYTEWHINMLVSLNDMDPLTKKGTLWNKRRALFGSLAEEIWQDELDTEQAKEQVIQETLTALHQADNMSMEERLYTLTNTIHEQYGDQHSNFLISKGMVADIYFHLDSVQKDLKNMSVEERASALADSRRQLGFSDKSIEEMAEKDAKNEARWENGYSYMAARDQYIQNYSGDELESKLTELRIKHFKHEAPTIEKEEASEFFRYERPRLYGSN